MISAFSICSFLDVYFVVSLLIGDVKSLQFI